MTKQKLPGYRNVRYKKGTRSDCISVQQPLLSLIMVLGTHTHGICDNHALKYSHLQTHKILALQVDCNDHEQSFSLSLYVESHL